MLLTRAWPRSSAIDDFDRWERDRHFPELVAGPGIVRASYYRAVVDRLPAAWVGNGLRLASYSARDIDGLLEWIASPELASAVADGSGWFERMNELDFLSFTGNVYRTVACKQSEDGHREPRACLLVERFEVGDEAVGEFDEWLEAHLVVLAQQAGVCRVRAFHAVRQGIAVHYYHSPGNRAVVVELSPDTEIHTIVRSEGMDGALADSMRWDRRLRYVKREAYVYDTHLDSNHSGADN